MAPSETELILRPVSANDADFLCQLCNDPRVRVPLALNEQDVDYWTRAIEEWSNDPDEGAFVVYSPRLQRSIGWVGVNGLSSQDGTAWVKMMALLPDIWGQGYCYICMSTVRNMLRIRGFERIRLWTDSTNRRAIRCYERSGFVRIGQQPRFGGDPPQERLRDLMECHLS